MQELLTPMLGTHVQIKQFNDLQILGVLYLLHTDYATIIRDNGQYTHIPYHQMVSVTTNHTELPKDLPSVDLNTIHPVFNALLSSLAKRMICVGSGSSAQQGVLSKVTENELSIVLNMNQMIHYSIPQIKSISLVQEQPTEVKSNITPNNATVDVTRIEDISRNDPKRTMSQFSTSKINQIGSIEEEGSLRFGVSDLGFQNHWPRETNPFAATKSFHRTPRYRKASWGKVPRSSETLKRSVAGTSSSAHFYSDDKERISHNNRSTRTTFTFTSNRSKPSRPLTYAHSVRKVNTTTYRRWSQKNFSIAVSVADLCLACPKSKQLVRKMRTSRRASSPYVNRSVVGL